MKFFKAVWGATEIATGVVVGVVGGALEIVSVAVAPLMAESFSELDELNEIAERRAEDNDYDAFRAAGYLFEHGAANIRNAFGRGN